MNTAALKKALLQGIPSALVAWVLYGGLTSLFGDDSIFEEMFESSGLFFAFVIAIVFVFSIYCSAVKPKKD
jgi:hypothetical protein